MGDLLVLCYHALSAEWQAPVSVTPDAFERQIAGLTRSGWTSATFTEAVSSPRPDRTLVVTFDDAFASVREHALPVLNSLGVRGTLFVPTEYITRRAPLAWEGLHHWAQGSQEHELRGMTWEDVGELAELGWEIGSHTATHPRLTQISDERLALELHESRAECAERVGRPVTSIAYPYGDVDDRVQGETARAGYEAAAALEFLNPRSGPLRHPRIGIYHGDSGARFRLKTGRWTRSRSGSRLLARRG